jgi:hypothetical protein
MSRMNGRTLAFAVVLCLPLLACQQGSELEPPPRPRGVPAEALWAGGVDGGDFIQLSPAKAAGIYSAKIYNDHSGELDFRGALRLSKPSAAPIDVNDPKTYSGWDGETLHLRDGRSLKQVGKK